MGKKLSRNQGSTKICKEDKKKEQHQLNSTIKILRPRVYITHSSDFKRLVQELTGYGHNNYAPILDSRTINNSNTIIHAVHPVQQPPIINIIEDEDNHHHQETATTSPDLSINVSLHNNATSVDILSYDSPLEEAGIIIPENINSILEEGFLQYDMENDHYLPAPPCGGDASLSPPSSSSCDWQLTMMDPFLSYNLHDFGDAFYNSFNIPTEQSLYTQQEVCVFENMELLMMDK